MNIAPNNWTQEQWYNFMCGLLAGLRLKEYGVPYYSRDTTLKPINVGGATTIGIGVETVEYKGEGQTVTVGVYTHDVNIDYSMFSVKLEYDSARCYVSNVYGGEFGTFGEDMSYSSVTGSLNVIGQKAAGTKFDKPMILFYIDFVVTDQVSENSRIYLKLKSTNDYEGTANNIIQNYTTLLKYIGENLLFITPVKNTNGAIVIKRESTQYQIGEDKTVAAIASPSEVLIGTASTGAGIVGTIPILTCSNADEGFEYNGFSVDVEIMSGSVPFVYRGTEGSNGWSLNVTESESESGNKVLHIAGTRAVAICDYKTVGYIEYLVNSDSYYIPLVTSNAQLINTSVVTEVKGVDGLVYYGDGVKKDVLPYGGVIIDGTIWSSTDQIIWIQMDDGPKIPVYVTQGENKIHVVYPYVYNKNTSKEGSLKIEAEGYILIPAGFVIEYIVDKKAPDYAVSLRKIDKVRVQDIYGIIVSQAPVPTPPEDTIEQFAIADIMSITVKTVNKETVVKLEGVQVSDSQNITSTTMTEEANNNSEGLAVTDIFEITVR